MRKMPAFTKAPPETVERFEAATRGIDALERRTMFSYPSVFLNGNMLACVFQDRIMVRLSDADRAQFLTMPDTRLFEPSPGRAMREYVEAPRSEQMPLEELRRWLERGVIYVAGMPVKKKPAAKKVTKKATKKIAKTSAKTATARKPVANALKKKRR